MKNLEKVKLNYEYRYRELCELFGQEEVDGNSRVAQFNLWNKHFDWYTKGKTRATRFIITKVYAEIELHYKVEDKVFVTKREAEEYAKSL